ncbi:MAG: F0F1 ATP synthase subunit epsilon [Deltaproteobacteria bacterium]|nr:F0F1 ATP synthase subunit epsilon [Deltaproteobacteria bacterium]
MAGETINLRVLTPAGLVFEDKASSVTIPSSMGEIGILPQHAKYSGLLGTGVLSYTPEASTTNRRIVVSQGFCNFSGDTLTILTDFVAQADKVDKASYATERPALEKVTSTGSTMEPEYQIAKEKLSRIEAIDQLLSTAH